MKCLVSGATGFIGRRLCQQLCARGDTVVGLSRHGDFFGDSYPSLALDLATQDPGPDLFKGVDVVFHLAGIAHQQAPQSAYEAVNNRATLRLARLARSAGVRCFVFLSSVKAMGASASTGPRSEGDCTLPLDAYGLSKWQAECALREEFAADSMSVIILRPALVYGAGVKGNLQYLARAARRGFPRPPAVGQRSMIALEDLVALLCQLSLHPPPGVHTWIASGTETYSTRAIYDVLRQGKGVAWLPLWAWKVVARLVDSLRANRAGTTFDKLFGTEIYCNGALVAATGWQPRLRLEDVLGNGASAGVADS